MKPEPKISFLFPYRWLTDDREHFAKNVKRQIAQQLGSNHSLEQLAGVALYRVEVGVTHREMVKVPLTAPQAKKILKEVFPYGNCVGVTTDYTQSHSRTSLPSMNFRIYY